MTVFDKKRLEKDGFGAILSVGKGSKNEPVLVQIEYIPETKNGRKISENSQSKLNNYHHIVLAGKGITFDTGGLSLKPAQGMELMKTDMAAAGAVMSAMTSLAELESPHKITALLPCAENSLGAKSYHPSDIVTSYDGTTIEVDNTDAEGRMVLCDVLSYAAQKLSPDLLIDLATLTGAATIALGRQYAPVYCNNISALTLKEVITSGKISHDKLWHMPLLSDSYGVALNSSVADIRQTEHPDSGVKAGSIIAAFISSAFYARSSLGSCGHRRSCQSIE